MESIDIPTLGRDELELTPGKHSVEISIDGQDYGVYCDLDINSVKLLREWLTRFLESHPDGP